MKLNFFFTFLLYIYGRESIVFWSNFWNWVFDRIAWFEAPWRLKSYFGWLVSVYVCVSVCYEYKSKTSNYRKFKSGILSIDHTEILPKILRKLVRLFAYRDFQNISNTLQPTDRISFYCILLFLNSPECNKMNKHLTYSPKYDSNRIWFE